jgi:hypothetical protein
MFKAQVAITDPKHWRDRAEEARLIAREMKDAVHRETVFRIAKYYDDLAQRTEKRARH